MSQFIQLYEINWMIFFEISNSKQLYLKYNGVFFTSAPGTWLSLFRVIVTMVQIWPYCPHRRAMLWESIKVSSLVQDVIRRMINTNDMEPQEVRDRILDAGDLKLLFYIDQLSTQLSEE